ncbi:unnamed protein product, partial [Staurois parvus]
RRAPSHQRGDSAQAHRVVVARLRAPESSGKTAGTRVVWQDCGHRVVWPRLRASSFLARLRASSQLAEQRASKSSGKDCVGTGESSARLRATESSGKSCGHPSQLANSEHRVNWAEQRHSSRGIRLKRGFRPSRGISLSRCFRAE